MIPPVAPSVFTANPQFALLHKQLTTRLLNPDASTRATSTESQPAATKLRQHHVQAAQSDILRRSLYDVVADKTLPSELAELVLTIATYLAEGPNMSLSDEAHNLMGHEVEVFQENLHIVAPRLSQHIQRERDSLLPLAASSNSTSKPTNPTSGSSLAPTLATRLTTLQDLHTCTIPAANATLSNTISSLLATHTAHLATQIRHLELHTHGTLSRHTHARATYLSTVAAGIEAKVQILALQAQQAMYTPAVQRALTAYAAHLRDFRESLREREEVLGRELELYHDVGGVGLKECARRYGVVGKEIEVVKAEIARLESEVGRKEWRGSA